jgi:SOS response regulatory protein OraA/RecX
MTDFEYQPPLVPTSSKDLVVKLKERLTEAVESGKAGEAKIFLDVIERLAKLNWLDDLSPQERGMQQHIESEETLRRIDAKILAMLVEAD